MSPLFSGSKFGFSNVGSSEFPLKYLELINSFFTKHYVSKQGSDTLGNGSITNPYLTINKALTVANTTGGVIIVGPGVYSESVYDSSFSEQMIRFSTSVTIVGTPGKTVYIESNNIGRRDNHFFGMTNAGSRIYGMIFKRDNNGRTNNYATSIWGNEAGATYGQIYNCVIEEVNANGRMSHVYDNSGTGGGKIYNSTIVSSVWLTPYTCGGSNETRNTALTSSNTFSLCGTSVDNTNGASINNKYYLTNKSNSLYGVYSGDYAWPQEILVPLIPASDAYSQDLLIALSGSSNQGFNNVAHVVKNVPDNFPKYYITSSTQRTFSQESKYYFDSLRLGLRSPSGLATWFGFQDPDVYAFSNFNFTLETWVYIPTFSGLTQCAFWYHTNGVDNTGFQCFICGDSFGDVSARRGIFFTGGAGAEVNIAFNCLSPNTWHHIAVVRLGSASNSLKIYVDGIDRTSYRDATGNPTWTYEGPLTVSAPPQETGWDQILLQDYRIYLGSAKYNSNFTPPGPMFI